MGLSRRSAPNPFTCFLVLLSLLRDVADDIIPAKYSFTGHEQAKEELPENWWQYVVHFVRVLATLGSLAQEANVTLSVPPS